MQRHELDSFSLFAGVAFVAITAAYTLSHTTGVRLHWLLVIPAFLLLMGAAVTVTAVRRILAGDSQADGDVSNPT
jgi:hypothetical protein